MDKENINHEFTNEVVCPFCGYEFSDSWEFGGDEDIGLINCESCEKEFYATRNVEITYSTQKAAYGTCKHCGEENVVIENYCSSNGSYKGLCVKCGEIEKRRLIKKYFEVMEEM